MDYGKAAEAIAILGGLALVISQVTGLITAFSESGLGLGQVAGLLGIVLGELAVAFIAIAAATKLMDWQGIVGAAVILGGFAIVINQVTNLIDVFAKSGLKLNDVIGLMATVFVTILALMGSVALIGPAMTAGLGPFLVLIAGISAVLLVLAVTIPEILNALGDFYKKVAPSVSQVIRTIGEQIQNIIKQLGQTLPPIINSVGNLFLKIFKGISGVIDTVGDNMVKVLRTVQSLIVTTLSSFLNFIYQLGPAIDNFVSHAIVSTTRLINFIVSGIEYLVNNVVVSGINKIISSLNGIGKYVGINISPISEQYIPRFVPRLYTGALINNPGKGVPVANGRAIAGEAGMEGILPLTDSQAMAELGKEIGKWIVVNLQNVTKLDSRVISRQMKKVANEKSFARNGV